MELQTRPSKQVATGDEEIEDIRMLDVSHPSPRFSILTTCFHLLHFIPIPTAGRSFIPVSFAS